MSLEQWVDISSLAGFFISVLGFIITIWTACRLKSLSKVLLESKIKDLITQQISTITNIKTEHNYGAEGGDVDGNDSISSKEKQQVNYLLDGCNEILSHLRSKKEIINLKELKELKNNKKVSWIEIDEVLTNLRKDLNFLKNGLSGEIMKRRRNK